MSALEHKMALLSYESTPAEFKAKEADTLARAKAEAAAVAAHLQDMQAMMH